MRLAALYSVFNGLELLEKSIEQINPFCDFIVICYQNTSNKGEFNPKVEQFVQRFNGKKFYLLPFEPEFSVNTKENERRKHQSMLDFAKVLGASHFMFSATDHFYLHSEFEKVMNDASRYDVTFTKMFTYYKYPTWRLTPIEDYHMPFICKLYPNTDVIKSRHYPVKVDPSIQFSTCDNWKVYDQLEIMMHHYSMIRQDIEGKFRNAAASIRWKNEQVERFIREYNNYDVSKNEGVSYFQGRTIEVVCDFFNLSN
jgi:hypothetical protein